MNSFIKRYSFVSIALCTIIFLSTTLHGQTNYKLTAQNITIEGTSTLHDWTETVSKVEWSGTLKVSGSSIKEVKNVKIKIPVSSIKSSKGNTMDNKTHDAFKSDKHPYITYNLTVGTIKPGLLATVGTLTMAGVSKKINMKINYNILPNGDINLTGSHTISLKDFGMEPPTAVLGTIKVGETVTVNLNLTVHE